MNPLFLHPTTKSLNDQPDEHTLVPIHEPPGNTSEGSEFLDDAIRNKDMPLTDTEEEVYKN